MRIKKCLMAAAFILSAICTEAKEPTQNDTIQMKNSEAIKIVEDESVNSKGQKVTKFYVLYEGELIKTSRNVVEAYNLCKKHGAKCHLAIVINKKNNHKRVIRN